MALSPVQQAIQDFLRDVYYTQTNAPRALDTSQYTPTQFDPNTGSIDPRIIRKHQSQSYNTPQTPQKTYEHAERTSLNNIQAASPSVDVVLNRQPPGNDLDSSDSMEYCATERITGRFTLNEFVSHQETIWSQDVYPPDFSDIYSLGLPIDAQKPYHFFGEMQGRDQVNPNSQSDDDIFDQLVEAHADAFSKLT